MGRTGCRAPLGEVAAEAGGILGDEVGPELVLEVKGRSRGLIHVIVLLTLLDQVNVQATKKIAKRFEQDRPPFGIDRGSDLGGGGVVDANDRFLTRAEFAA